MEKKYCEERWLLANNSTGNSANIDEDEEEQETLSLSDLPLIHNSKTEQHEEETKQGSYEKQSTQDEFDFCRSFSENSEMCVADEVFFQGQIVPLRHSISSEKGLLKCNSSRSVSRSESMDRSYSGGLFSSRSSSINSSHQSSSSGGSGSSSAVNLRRRHPKPPRNQFHSHPSPSPRIQKQANFNLNQIPNPGVSKKSSSMWSIFRLGLVTPPPEIAFQDYKPRCPSNNRSNSKNSSISNSSEREGMKNVVVEKKKNKRPALFTGCKCSADAVDTVSSKIVLVKRSESDEESAIKKSPKITKQQETKKQMSHHRTFEWLKQLSIDAATDEA